MSNPIAKRERSRAKDLRQGVVPQRGKANPGRRKRAKIDKPFKVMAKPILTLSRNAKPWCIHRDVTREGAERWIEKNRRSYAGKGADEYWIEDESAGKPTEARPTLGVRK